MKNKALLALLSLAEIETSADNCCKYLKFKATGKFATKVDGGIFERTAGGPKDDKEKIENIFYQIRP